MKHRDNNSNGEAVNGRNMASAINAIMANAPPWISSRSEANDNIILSTRVRLARNVKSILFPSTAKRTQLNEVIDLVRDACAEIEMLEEAFIIDMSELEKIDEQILVERRLVSPNFVTSSHPRLVIVANSEQASIMINEEDHLRIQSLQPGLALQETWEIISLLDDELSDKLDYAFSAQFGYLSACPTNTGTGMRASILVHLPALSLTYGLEKLMKDLQPSEIAIRGFYGEGSEIMGNIYQVSNQLTLGRTEKSILGKLDLVAKKIVEAEMRARERLSGTQRNLLEDKVFRTLGILRNARIMSSQELMNHLSMIQLGLDLNLIHGLEAASINELMLVTQPAHMQKARKTTCEPGERDTLRAKMIRQKFESLEPPEG